MARAKLEITLRFQHLEVDASREGEIIIPPGASDADVQDALQRLICSMFRAIQMEKELLDKGSG